VGIAVLLLCFDAFAEQFPAILIENNAFNFCPAQVYADSVHV
jgi:uncharacterized membrane protein